MRHLKLFEAFDRDEYWDDYLDKLNANLKKSAEDSKINWDDYYQSIDYDTAAERIVNMTELTKGEFDEIKSVIGDVYKFDLKDWKVIDIDNKTGNVFKYVIAEREGFKYRIWKLEDEWYLVEMGDPSSLALWFLCDQVDGLKALLNKTSIKR